MIRDLGSRQGTFVDGERVSTALLTPGVRVVIGAARFLVSSTVESTVSIDPRVVPLSDLEFAPAREIDNPLSLVSNYERLRVVYELGRATDIEQNLDRILHRTLLTAFKLLSAERGIIELFESTGLARTRSHTRSGPASDLELSKTVVREVIEGKKGLIIADAQGHSVFGRAESICIEGVRSVMCVPLIYQDEILGVFQVDTHTATHAFDARDLMLFSTIASRVAVSVKDVSVREKAANANKDGLVRAERILEQLSIGVAELDTQLRPTRVNPAAKAVIDACGEFDGECLQRLAGVSVADLFSPDGGPRRTLICGQDAESYRLVGSVTGGQNLLVLEPLSP